MHQNLPCGGQVVVDRPCRLIEGIYIILVVQHHIAVEHLVGAPLATEKIAQIIDIQPYIQRVLVARHIEVEFL